MLKMLTSQGRSPTLDANGLKDNVLHSAAPCPSPDWPDHGPDAPLRLHQSTTILLCADVGRKVLARQRLLQRELRALDARLQVNSQHLPCQQGCGNTSTWSMLGTTSLTLRRSSTVSTSM